jgi:hypothetical protein
LGAGVSRVRFAMINVHLYGKLRRFAEDATPTSQSVVDLEWQPGDTVRRVIERLGVPIEDLGSNLFLNGRYADFESRVENGDRLGLFPDDMQLLYKWYFSPKRGEEPEK